MLSHVPLFATPWTVARQAPVSMRILQARILEWVAVPFSRGFPNPGIEPRSPALQVQSLPSEPPEKPIQEAGWCHLAPTENPNKVQVLYDSLFLISRKPGDPPPMGEGLYPK